MIAFKPKKLEFRLLLNSPDRNVYAVDAHALTLKAI